MGQLSALRNLNAAVNGTITYSALETAISTRQGEWSALFNNSYDLTKLMQSMTGLGLVGQSASASTALLANTKVQAALTANTTSSNAAINKLMSYSAFTAATYANSTFNTTLASAYPSAVLSSKAALASMLTSNTYSTWLPKWSQRTGSYNSEVGGAISSVGRGATSNPANDDIYYLSGTGFVAKSTDGGDTFINASTNFTNAASLILANANAGLRYSSTIDTYASLAALVCSNGTTAFLLTSSGTAKSYLTSTTDFVTFTAMPLLPGVLNDLYDWHAITSSATTLLVVGKSKQSSTVYGCVSSDGGNTWGTPFQIVASGYTISAIGYLNNEFCVVANNYLYTSANGSTGWTAYQFHTNASTTGRGITYSGTKYVIPCVTYDGANYADSIYTSSNKTTWAGGGSLGVTNPGFFNLGGIASNGAGTLVLVAFYQLSGNQYCYVRRSTDHGATWANLSISAIADYSYGAVCYSAATGGFIGQRGGSASGSQQQGFTVSSSGTYTAIRGQINGVYRWAQVVHGGNAYFIRYDNLMYRLRSTDGLNLDSTCVMNMLPTYYTSNTTYPSCIRWCNNQLLAFVSVNYGTAQNYMARSTDGKWWTNFVTLPSVGDFQYMSSNVPADVIDVIYATLGGTAYYFALTAAHTAASLSRGTVNQTTDLTNWSMTPNSQMTGDTTQAVYAIYTQGRLEYLPATSTYPEAVVRPYLSGSGSAWTMYVQIIKMWQGTLQAVASTGMGGFTTGYVGGFQVSGNWVWVSGMNSTAGNKFQYSINGGSTFSASQDYSTNANHFNFRNIIPNITSIMCGDANGGGNYRYNAVSTGNAQSLFDSSGLPATSWVELSGNRHLAIKSTQIFKLY